MLTASEDGSLRWLLVNQAGEGSGEGSAASSSSPRRKLAASGLVRALSDGSALRACACVPTPGSSSSGGDFLVFASGVRAYVTAWRAWWSDGGGGETGRSGAAAAGGGGKEEEEKKPLPLPLRLRTSWLAASSAGVRSGRAARRARSRSSRAEASPRALHAAAFEIAVGGGGGGGEEEGEGARKKKGVVAVLVATSLGDVEAVAFDSLSGQFLQPSPSDPEPVRLECHEGPALCVSHLSMSPSDESKEGLLGGFFLKNGLAFSGSTDGGVAVWSGAEVAEALFLSAAAPPFAPNSSSSSLPPAPAVKPLELLPALHQSGVNCLAAVTVATLSKKKRDSSRSVLLVTGGDDGALRLTLLSVSVSVPTTPVGNNGGEKRRTEVSVAASATLEGAHSSCALRGAWIGEVEQIASGSGGGGPESSRAEVVTVGLDQRLRGWAASIVERSESSSSPFAVSLAPLWSVPVQVPAPECLAVLPERGLVSVSGRGTQAFSWK